MINRKNHLYASDEDLINLIKLLSHLDDFTQSTKDFLFLTEDCSVDECLEDDALDFVAGGVKSPLKEED